MLNKLKLISLITVAALGLQACGDDDKSTAGAPKQLVNINTAVYSVIRQNPAANAIFAGAGATNVGDEPCEVKVHRMSFDTVGGKGEATTSSGVFMLPHGDDARCQGDRPVLLYAHGTSSEKNYDLSQIVPPPGSPTNAAASEAVMLLAAYASQGYAVVAPNYAGYSDSTLDYHPYVNEVQQSTEMIDALMHVREYAGMLGAKLSSELFISGTSQGGYVAMATHKALQASGEKVSASMPVSGPYALLDFIDTIFAGYVNAGATTFAPLYLNGLERAFDIYDDPSEVYDAAYAGTAENALPAVGGFTTTGFPATAIFGGEPPEGANALHAMGFGADHLLSDAFRVAYLTDAGLNADAPENKIRKLVKDGDLRNWKPMSPLMMCGAANDPVVYYPVNTGLMNAYWADLVAAGLVSSLDLSATPAGPFASVMGAFQAAGIELPSVHGSTGVYCALAGVNYFNAVRAQMAAAAAAN
ncbi:MAG: alpha/beta hydrolase family protein [Thiolinea sp.]